MTPDETAAALRNVAVALANEVGRLDSPHASKWRDLGTVPGHVLNMIDDVRRLARGEAPYEVWPDVDPEGYETPNRRYLLVTEGYEDNDNGADDHPDAYESIEFNDERQMLAHIEKIETVAQEILALRASRHGVSDKVWKHIDPRYRHSSLGYELGDGPLVRTVYEAREIDVTQAIERAKAAGKSRADAGIAAAEAMLLAIDEEARTASEKRDRTEFERLKAKFGESTS